jgi:RNA polymerase subunit RPABC4/transcription elongation factor Spt4
MVFKVLLFQIHAVCRYCEVLITHDAHICSKVLDAETSEIWVGGCVHV